MYFSVSHLSQIKNKFIKFQNIKTYTVYKILKYESDIPFYSLSKLNYLLPEVNQ